MEESEKKSAMSILVVEMVVAISIFVIGTVVICDSWRLGAKWGAYGPESGYFPFYTGLILCLASFINFAVAWKKKNTCSFVSVDSLKTVTSVMIPAIIFVALIGGVGPIPPLGMYVASILYIGIFMKWLGKCNWALTIVIPISVSMALFFMFDVWFKVPLPKGILESALGLN